MAKRINDNRNHKTGAEFKKLHRRRAARARIQELRATLDDLADGNVMALDGRAFQVRRPAAGMVIFYFEPSKDSASLEEMDGEKVRFHRVSKTMAFRCGVPTSATSARFIFREDGVPGFLFQVNSRLSKFAPLDNVPTFAKFTIGDAVVSPAPTPRQERRAVLMRHRMQKIEKRYFREREAMYGRR